MTDEDYSQASCDQCGPSVRARVVAALPNGGVLTYCGHCAGIHRPALERTGAFLFEVMT